MANKKDSRPQAAHGNWKVTVDQDGVITDCYGFFDKANAASHACGTAEFINCQYTWVDEKQHQAHHPKAIAVHNDISNFWEVDVPLLHARAFVAWLEDHNIPVEKETRINPRKGRWADQAKPKESSGQGLLFNPDGGPGRTR